MASPDLSHEGGALYGDPKQQAAWGTLYVVATPIGNLEDITLRALRVLREVDLVAAEDTRHTGRLLAHYGIRKPLVSYYEWNERQRARQLLSRIRAGEKVALVCDAGTPGLSDPAFRLVGACAAGGLPVRPIPGAAAVTAALSAAGLPTDRFRFEGFLPPKGGKRSKRLAALLEERCTVVLYESPHRLGRLLEEVAALAPERRVVVARELTKLHEEFLRGRAGELAGRLSGQRVRGECVVLIEGRGRERRRAGEPNAPARRGPRAVLDREGPGE
ncbi:MAG: 16S rRNA (cytidine(1402)-2'-O)-methyltransferase [Nitrospinota bacterium]